MSSSVSPVVPVLDHLPQTLPLEGAVRIELEEGVPVFKATRIVIERIESLLDKQKLASLTADEQQELNEYEEMDDFLSLVNRTVRNLVHHAQAPTPPAPHGPS